MSSDTLEEKTTSTVEVPQIIRPYLLKLQLPKPESHKGQNGKLLIIGGSELFHAASRWSLDVASKFVDMVFYSSVPSNNKLIKEAKGEFWNGMVINRTEMEPYVEEADCILIGPGMTRTADTEKLTNQLLKKYPDKKWVIDAGALQMVEPKLLTETCIITPHQQEFVRLMEKVPGYMDTFSLATEAELKRSLKEASDKLQGATIVRKAHVDFVVRGPEFLFVAGGNGGMTKGGTGDVLAGLIAALYCKNEPMISAVLGSYYNKKAGDSLYRSVGPNFNASDLVAEIPKVIWQEAHSTAETPAVFV